MYCGFRCFMSWLSTDTASFITLKYGHGGMRCGYFLQCFEFGGGLVEWLGQLWGILKY